MKLYCKDCGTEISFLEPGGVAYCKKCKLFKKKFQIYNKTPEQILEEKIHESPK